MRRIRLISLSVTALAAVLIVVLLLVLRLGLPTRKEWPPERENEVSLYEEEFIEVMEEVGSGQQSAVSGQRSRDGGEQSAVSSQQSVGSEERSAEEQTRNRVSSEVKNRFGAATAPSSPTQSEQSTTSSPTNEGSGLVGVGSGTVGGGWKMPSYQKIRSTSVGSIIVQLTLDRSGNITALDFVGGTPPAYSDASLRAAVEKEIRARRFTRTDDDAPERATARITYTFQ